MNDTANNPATGVKAKADAEMAAIQTIYGAFLPLESESQVRVLKYITSLLQIGTAMPDEAASESELAEADEAARTAPTFRDFAELEAATNPSTNAERALVAGYWLQVCQGQESFTAAAAQKELMNLGLRLPNITNAITDLKEQRPQLVLQLRKSGTSKQARKTYKVSHAGVVRVEEMISG